MLRSLRLRRGSALTAVALAAVALLWPLALPAASAHAAADDAGSADDVTWSVRTESNGFGAERTSYTYAVDPGQSVSDALVIANHGAAALQLAVYPADGYTGAGGTARPADGPRRAPPASAPGRTGRRPPSPSRRKNPRRVPSWCPFPRRRPPATTSGAS
ncbi:hypothetical protein [Microbacterium sp. B24]|uniref:hypothetical protein n=1 Tax=Microbacterium sp. B24 TaxID=95616 RepID=UPI0011D2BA4E|nr:hypothetical protein [Microbacterium sp. B24]